MGKRKRIPVDKKIIVLTESGYRCGNPACRFILTLELHHIVCVSDSGSDDTANLLPLCANCHAMYTRGHIPLESIRAWKIITISLSKAFDQRATDVLLTLFSRVEEKIGIFVSGEGVLQHASLIASELLL